MEPTQAALRKRFRLILTLGKFQVLERGHNTIKVALGGSTTMTITDPIIARLDIRAGDILTYYTEAPLAEPSPTPQQ